MAREMDMSQTAVSRIWRAFDLQPHLQETFKLSEDPLFVEKVSYTGVIAAASSCSSCEPSKPMSRSTWMCIW